MPGYEAAKNDPQSSSGNPTTTSTDPAFTSGYEAGKNDPYSSSGDPTATSKDPASSSGYGSSALGTSRHPDTSEPAGYGGVQESGLSDPYTSSQTPGRFDDVATTASIKSGVPGRAPLTDQSGTFGALDTNKPLPSEPNSGLPGTTSSNTVGPHSSNLANEADPRVDSDLDGSKGLGTNNDTQQGLLGSALPDRSIGR